jgi:biopolymer transport protein TolR
MAFQTQKTQTVLSEINVTPLVDVMLVLLIVFMISAPLMQQGVQVDLPKAKAPTLNESQEKIFITLSKEGQLTLNKESFKKETLLAKLQALASAQGDPQVYLQADQAISYGQVATLMAEIKASGINRVGLVTLPK